MRFFLLVLCFASSLILSQSLARAKSTPLKAASRFEYAVEFIYSKEFKRLSLEDQKSYIKDLRAFVVALENVGIKPQKKSRKLESWFEYLTRLQEAQAAQGETCDLTSPRTGLICLRCPSFGKIKDELTSTPGTICRGSPEALNSALKDKTTVFPDVNVNENQLKEFSQSGEGFSQITVDTKLRNGVTMIRDTPAGTKYVRLPDNKPIVKPSEADPATKIERVKDDVVTETSSNKVGAKLDGVADKQSAISESVDTLKQLRDNFSGSLRCIYAGFPISGSTCEGKTEFTLEKGKTLSCTAQSDDDSTIAASEPDAKKTILCNPLLFGLDEKDKPLCVRKSKTATKDCDTLANNTPNSLSKTLALNRENPNEAKKIGWTLQALCLGPEDAVKTFLQERGSTNPDRSYADIKSTCESFERRFSSYWQQFDAPASQSKGWR